MRVVGYVSILFGVVALIPTLLAIASFGGMLLLFESISLMIALRKLRSVYTVQAWLMAIACVFVAVDLVLFFKR